MTLGQDHLRVEMAGGGDWRGEKKTLSLLLSLLLPQKLMESITIPCCMFVVPRRYGDSAETLFFRSFSLQILKEQATPLLFTLLSTVPLH